MRWQCLSCYIICIDLILCYVMLCYVTSHYIILYCVLLYNMMILYYITLYRIMSYYIYWVCVLLVYVIYCCITSFYFILLRIRVFCHYKILAIFPMITYHHENAIMIWDAMFIYFILFYVTSHYCYNRDFLTEKFIKIELCRIPLKMFKMIYFLYEKLNFISNFFFVVIK